jgi:hypothetical protein
MFCVENEWYIGNLLKKNIGINDSNYAEMNTNKKQR